MKRIIRLNESDLTRIVRRIIKETTNDPRMYHRYTDGGNPGIEDFLKNPLNAAIARELEQQLEDDEYANIDNPTNIGRGTRVLKIKLNGREMSIDDFIDQIQEDAEDGKCHTIDEYEYKNRFLGSTIITIKTDIGSCKGISKTQQNQTNNSSSSNTITPNYDFDTEDEFGDLINKYDSKSADKLKTDVINFIDTSNNILTRQPRFRVNAEGRKGVDFLYFPDQNCLKITVCYASYVLHDALNKLHDLRLAEDQRNRQDPLTFEELELLLNR
jgi:hypothetical protein